MWICFFGSEQEFVSLNKGAGFRRGRGSLDSANARQRIHENSGMAGLPIQRHEIDESPDPALWCGASGEPETGLFGMRTKV